LDKDYRFITQIKTRCFTTADALLKLLAFIYSYQTILLFILTGFTRILLFFFFTPWYLAYIASKIFSESFKFTGFIALLFLF